MWQVCALLLKKEKVRLNGSKTFITNGVYADYYIVAAKTDLGQVIKEFIF
jgi:alkylation response protein AidB-like acyl-CoA dehydrogenase